MKALRIAILLCIFVFVAFYTKLQRLESTAWIDTLPVFIYPINADQTLQTNAYINSLSEGDFYAVESFLKTQWRQHRQLKFVPVVIKLQKRIELSPPAPPSDANILKIMFWSLRLRFWAYQYGANSDKSVVDIFVRYHQVKEGETLAHSLGLQKGLIGVVNAYADSEYQGKNNIVIAHELLHTVGATDKYDLVTGQPIYPDAFVDMNVGYKQSRAEIMAGRIPVSKSESVMPESLNQCVLSYKTAVEIGWIDDISDVNK